jgi:hypothetical protein
MAERIKIFPLIVLAAVVILGLLLYFVATRTRETRTDPAAPAAPPEPTQFKESRPSSKEAVQAPPVSKDPGEKILEGADGAFSREMFPTALMFYKDFELRYAGTEVYDRHITRVWERIHTSNASIKQDKQESSLPAYLESRRKLAEEWKKVKPLMSGAPADQARAEVLKFQDSLPPLDGRRKVIEAWLAPPKDGK